MSIFLHCTALGTKHLAKICEVKEYSDLLLTLFANEFNFKMTTKDNSRDLSKEIEVVCHSQ